ncbi:hypothetical protein SAMN04488053_102245 [Alkalicoccus daliensis]|uniref:Lmo0937 family membrane protein n=1 Tax=Alkalicoccus daliensis TaxID=745820 RepID=A0A1H0CVF3_9BACI|nr:hypothetical protein SAMN04488053_102245 [Alkalicoccus daliensis]
MSAFNNGNSVYSTTLINLEMHPEIIPLQNEGVNAMIWTIIGILILFWLVGFIADFGGGLIHTLLVIALIVAVVNMIMGRRA